MKRKTLYPKTERIGNEKTKVFLTEKLDGSNLCFANVGGRLLVAQRNNYFFYDDVESEDKKKFYKGLGSWLEQHHEELLSSIYEGSVVCGEWIGMGKISYKLDKRFYAFAKARVEWKEGDYDPTFVKINYNPEFLKYAFNEQEFPSFVGQVPLAYELEEVPTVEKLDKLYDEYISKAGTNVEGFVITINNETIKKYVRFKDGKMSPHKP